MPKALSALANTRVLGGGNGEGYSELRDDYLSRPLTFSDRYTLFYLLWCLALKEGMEYADYRLNIDTLCISEDAAAVIEKDLAQLGIDGLSFADAQCPVSVYSPEEQAQFEHIEAQVHDQLIDSGWTEQELNGVLAERELHRPQRTISEPSRVAEQLGRQRQLTQGVMLARSELAAQQSTEIGRLDSLLSESKQQLAANDAQLEALGDELSQTQAQLGLLGDELSQTQARLDGMTALSNGLAGEVEQLKGMYAAILRSWSWRLTLPLRWFGTAGQVLTGRRPLRGLLVQVAGLALARYPRVSRRVLRLLKVMPPLYRSVIALLYAPVEASPVLGDADLNQRARVIHAQLCERLGLKVEDL